MERGRAVAVRAFVGDGEGLAGAPYQVYSPADPRNAWQKGETDRRGWLAFVPDAAGSWRVKVADASGHGLDLRVDAEGPVGAAGPAWLPFLLRPVLGLAAIGAAFAALLAWHRRKRP